MKLTANGIRHSLISSPSLTPPHFMFQPLSLPALSSTAQETINPLKSNPPFTEQLLGL